MWETVFSCLGKVVTLHEDALRPQHVFGSHVKAQAAKDYPSKPTWKKQSDQLYVNLSEDTLNPPPKDCIFSNRLRKM